LTEFITGGSTAANETPTFRRYEPGRVEIEVTMNRPGFLVLADVYFVGWQAWSGGKSLPILRANRAMRAVPLPAGKHVVEFIYASRSFTIGAVASALAWPLAALFAWRLRRRAFVPAQGRSGGANRSNDKVSE
jgi:uncharacterized membrane protein YfhO